MLKIEQLKRKIHKRKQFQCGNSELDKYIAIFAGQDQEKKIAVPYVLVDEKLQVTGFYTLSNYSIYIKNCPEHLRKRLPQHPYLPAILIGKLTLKKEYQGRGWGKVLLMDALKNCYKYSTAIAAYAVCVYAKDDSARKFYQKYNFMELNDDPYHLFLPMNVIAKLPFHEHI